MPTTPLHQQSRAWIRTIDEGKGYTPLDTLLFRKLIARAPAYAFYRTLRRYVRPGSTVLEAGCGWAMSSFALAAEGVSVTALDISEKLITDLRQLQVELGGNEATHLSLVAGDIFRLQELQRTFDVVSSDGTYEHFLHSEERRQILAQVRTVLKNDGFFLVAVPNLHNPFFRSVVDARMPSMHSFTQHSLATELTEEGFRIRETGCAFVNPGFEQWVRSRWMVAGIRTANALFPCLPPPAKRLLAAHLYCVAQKA